MHFSEIIEQQYVLEALKYTTMCDILPPIEGPPTKGAYVAFLAKFLFIFFNFFFAGSRLHTDLF